MDPSDKTESREYARDTHLSVSHFIFIFYHKKSRIIQKIRVWRDVIFSPLFSSSTPDLANKMAVVLSARKQQAKALASACAGAARREAWKAR